MATNKNRHSHLPEDLRYYSPWDLEQKGLPREKGHKVL